MMQSYFAELLGLSRLENQPLIALRRRLVFAHSLVIVVLNDECVGLVRLSVSDEQPHTTHRLTERLCPAHVTRRCFSGLLRY